jgi:four helix bundle protein
VEKSAVNSYRDLRVWQEAMSLAETCYRLTRNFPKEELFGMASQIRRSSASIAANIAEGHGREQTRSFIHFLRMAQGSLKELETHLLLAERVEIVQAAKVTPLLLNCEVLGKRLRTYIRALQRREAEV